MVVGMFRFSKNIKSEFNDVNSKVDFTLLDPRATYEDLEKFCDVAFKNRYYSVCVNSVNVAYVKGLISKCYPNALKVCSVIGFPLGATSISTKYLEAKEALQNGADELDVVINIGEAKQGNFLYVKDELSKIKKLAKRKVVKAIIETCYFDKNEIQRLCKICMQAKVDFIKTSTGFGTGGATEEDVLTIKKTVGGRCSIKASGGIRTRAQAIKLIELGADRIGTSHLI